MAQYKVFAEGTDVFRKGVRAPYFVIDYTLTPTGFDGVEGTDWDNLQSFKSPFYTQEATYTPVGEITNKTNGVVHYKTTFYIPTGVTSFSFSDDGALMKANLSEGTWSFTEQSSIISINIFNSLQSVYGNIQPPPQPIEGALLLRNYDWSEWFTQEVYDYYDAQSWVKNENDYPNKIYFDPTFAGTSDGSINAPYKHIVDAPRQANTAYLFKRGTTMVMSDHRNFQTQCTNIMVGAYGEGALPKVTNYGFQFETDNCVIRDIDITYVQLGTINHAANNAVIFNKRGGSMWSWSHGMRLIGSEITDTSTNGLFQQLRSSNGSLNIQGHIEIAYCWIHKVNQLWTPSTGQWTASGDCIIISLFRGTYHIHHNILDRSDTGNKQTLIINSHTNGGHMVGGIIEDNLMYGPMGQPDGSSIIMLGNVVGENLPSPSAYHHSIIRRNVLIGTDYQGSNWTGAALYATTTLCRVYGNILMDLGYAAYIGSYNGQSEFWNNTVVKLKGTGGAIVGTLHYKYNNIFPSSNQGSSAQSGSGNNIDLSVTSPTDVFLNYAEENFRLKTGSPAVDAGSYQSFMGSNYLTDIRGVSVPQNNNIDIGALQKE